MIQENPTWMSACGRAKVHHGDCINVLRAMPDNSVDAVVTDPPYGLKFMGKKWDYDVPGVDVWSECLRVLKPGGHLLAFAGTRTQHRMAVRIEDAGFEIRDMIAWVYGSGFPKSHNLGGDWQGWGTALKPAMEPITVARKPLCGTVAQNVQAWGTGAINVDGGRVGTETLTYIAGETGGDGGKYGTRKRADVPTTVTGRWPANLIHDGSDEVLAGFPMTTSGNKKASPRRKADGDGWGMSTPDYCGDSGSAARFFYCAKASKADREAGLEQMLAVRVKMNNGNDSDGDPVSNRFTKTARNHHPTVKPTALMRYLCRLVTQPGGIVLDPFAGSGSTGKAAMLEGFRFVGIEREHEYVNIARMRIQHSIDPQFALEPCGG